MQWFLIALVLFGSFGNPRHASAADCLSLLGDPQPVGVHALYSLMLSSSAAKAMEQHEFRGQAVVPGAAFLSNALQAVSLLDPKRPIVTLEPFTIEGPLLLTKEMGTSVLLTQVSSVQKYRASVSVGSRDSSNRLTLHAVGEAKIAKSWPKDSGAPYPVFSDEGEAVSKQSLYEAFDRIGLNYGALFRRVLSLSVHGFWVDALVEPVPGEKGFIHPAFLDSVLQTLIAPLLAAEERRQRDGLSPAPPSAAVPLFFGRVTWNSAAPPDSIYRVRAHLINGLPTASDSQMEYRVLVTTSRDVPVLQIEEGRLGIFKENFNF